MPTGIGEPPFTVAVVNGTRTTQVVQKSHGSTFLNNHTGVKINFTHMCVPPINGTGCVWEPFGRFPEGASLTDLEELQVSKLRGVEACVPVGGPELSFFGGGLK